MRTPGAVALIVWGGSQRQDPEVFEDT